MKCSHGTIITSMAVVLLLEVIGIDMDMAGRGRIREEGGKSQESQDGDGGRKVPVTK